MAVRVLALFVLLLMQAGLAAAAPRVALVIGNGSYEGAASLANPVNDAGDIAAKLRELGFDVVEGQDLGKREMEQKIGEFSDRLEGAEAAVLYYAGHGVAVAGRNFVVPVDAHLDAPAKLKFESISVDDIAELMRSQTPVSILILDACRNNPFGRGPAMATRGVTEGAIVAAQSYAGSYTVYAAQDGAVALDGKERNSPFAAALLKRLATPGASVETVMGLVKADVEEMTQGFQSPDAKGLLTRAFSFAPETAVATRAIAPADGQGTDAGPAALYEAQAVREISSLIRNQYLKPDPGTLVELVREIFADTVASYGQKFSNAELAAAKAQFFRSYSKWQLAIVPGTLKTTFYNRDSADVSFQLGFRYWPKKSGQKVRAGVVEVVLGMVRESGNWKIASEFSR